MADIVHRIGIAGPASKVYNALTTDEGLRQWWKTDTTGAGAIGSVIKFRFGEGGPTSKYRICIPTRSFSGGIPVKPRRNGWAPNCRFG